MEEDDISVHFIAANAQVTDDLRKGEESRYRAFNRRQVLHRKRVLKERTFTHIFHKVSDSASEPLLRRESNSH